MSGPAKVLVALLVAAVVGYFLFGRSAAPAPVPEEPPRVVATETIKASGGTIEVRDPASEVNGMTVQVPSGAYAADTPFKISTTPFRGGGLGAFAPRGLLRPVTPVIKIENGGGFAGEPLTLTIPVKKSADEFAMAFYYDEATGKLEGIPTRALTETSITVVTSHFSSLLVSCAGISEIEGRLAAGITTGFAPGVDDFQMPNYGSVVAPGGHCAGQSIAAMYYWAELKQGKGAPPLYGLYDNNKRGKTPGLWQDDAWAIRLCSAVQEDLDGDSTIVEAQRAVRGMADPLTFLAFAYAMILTGEPQYVTLGIGDQIGGHAIVAYKIDRTGLYVADPNYPGEARRILLEDETATPLLRKFRPYGSGANAQEVKAGGTAYDRIGYIAKSSMVDWAKVGSRWAALASGKVAPECFDPGWEVSVDVMTGRDAENNPVFAPLVDGYKTNKKTAEMYTGKPGKLTVRLICRYASGYVDGYKGATSLGRFSPTTEKSWLIFDLDLTEGDNDFGFFVTLAVEGRAGEFYVNFTRYKVVYSAKEDEVRDPPPRDPPGPPAAGDRKILRKQTTCKNTGCGTEYVEWDYGYYMKEGREERHGPFVEYGHTHLITKQCLTYKWREGSYKDGKLDGPYVKWRPFTQQGAASFFAEEESTYKDGESTGTTTHRALWADVKLDNGQYARIIMKRTYDAKTGKGTDFVRESILETYEPGKPP